MTVEYTHTSCIQLLLPATNFLLYLLKHVNDRLSIFAKNVIQKLYNDYHDDVGKLSAGNIHQTSLKVEKLLLEILNQLVCILAIPRTSKYTTTIKYFVREKPFVNSFSYREEISSIRKLA